MKQQEIEGRVSCLVRHYLLLEPEQQESIDYLIRQMLALRPPPQNIVQLVQPKK